MNKLITTVTAGVVVALSACADAAPLTVPSGLDPLLSHQGDTRAMAFVHRSPDAPPFKDEVVTLEVRSGVAGSATLNFVDGTPFARFSVQEETLTGATLNGTPIPAGESITVTLRRVDASRYIVDLQPSGIVFNPEAPATVEFYYENARLPRGDVAVYKQDSFGESWSGVKTVDQHDRRLMSGRVDDFTLYAMSAAY